MGKTIKIHSYYMYWLSELISIIHIKIIHFPLLVLHQCLLSSLSKMKHLNTNIRRPYNKFVNTA